MRFVVYAITIAFDKTGPALVVFRRRTTRDPAQTRERKGPQRKRLSVHENLEKKG
jgi:hypothetical protein